MNYFDLHCDTAVKLYSHKQSVAKNDFCVSLEHLSRYHHKNIVFAICAENHTDENTAYDYFLNVYNYLKKEIEKNKSDIRLITSSTQLKEDSSKLGIILCAENAIPIGNDLDKLRQLYKCGLRVLCPAWEGVNKVCGAYNTEYGWSDFGKEVVFECEKMGIIIDVSHLSKKAFFELSDFAKRPFFASHSCSASAFPHPRNLSGVQINTIMQKGGICGLNLVKKHLSPLLEATPKKRLALELFKKHIMSFFEECESCRLSLGLDFDGTETIEGLENTSFVVDIYNYLLKNGIKESKLCEIFYNNAFTFFSDML